MSYSSALTSAIWHGSHLFFPGQPWTSTSIIPRLASGRFFQCPRHVFSFLWICLPVFRICGQCSLLVQCPQLALNQREALTRSCLPSSGTAFKLRVLPLVLSWAALQLCPCLTMSLTRPDLQTWHPGLTSDPPHHYGFVWQSELLTEPSAELFCSCLDAVRLHPFLVRALCLLGFLSLQLLGPLPLWSSTTLVVLAHIRITLTTVKDMKNVLIWNICHLQVVFDLYIVSYFLIGHTGSLSWEESEGKGLGGVFTNEIVMQNHKTTCFSFLGDSFGLIWHFITIVLRHCSHGSNTSKELELSLGRSGKSVLNVAKMNYISEHLSYYFRGKIVCFH